MNRTSGIRPIPLGQLVFSHTRTQVERRALFNQDALKELATTIKENGRVEQPITVRPTSAKLNGEAFQFEVADGERRVIATEIAGLDEILAEVRTLTDEQVEQIQIVTGLQKEGLHELVEAEGYETLLKRGLSVDEIAIKCGKSKATVYARMKLLALCPDARKAFRKGKVSASIALLIARIPGGDQQQRALDHVSQTDWRGEPLSCREASKYVHDTFMLKLSDAPFFRDDPTLVPSAGACGPCPMRTGNCPDLFGDVKGADVCTNPECFRSKKAAHIKRELEKAKATGDKVIRGGDAKRILPDNRYYSHSSDGSHKHLRNGYARPSDKCLDDPKKRTYAELAGKDAPNVLLQHPDTGRVEKIFQIESIADRLKAKGIKPTPPAKSPAEAREQDREREEQKRNMEQQSRGAIFRAVVAAAPARLGRAELEAVALSQFDTGYGEDDEIYEALGWPTMGKRLYGAASTKEFSRRLGDLSDADLSRLVYALTVVKDAVEDYGEADGLLAMAKRLKVDVAKIRKGLAAAEEQSAPSVAKASKKKAAKKAKP